MNSTASTREECACPRCGFRAATVVLQSPDRQFPRPEIFFVSRCDCCGLLFQNPRIRLEALAKHYPDNYAPYAVSDIELDAPTLWHLRHRQGYVHLDCGIKPTAGQRRRGRALCTRLLLPGYVANGTVLEIGCAAGNRLALLRSLGWRNCFGSEQSAHAADKAARRGLEVITGPAETALTQFADATFDAVVGGFVVEHVADPFALTRVVAQKLRPGGLFVFSTVNVETPDFALYGAHWYNLDLPRHMVLFRKRDLRAMVSRDFTLERMRVESAPQDYLGSAGYRSRDGVGGWRRRFDSVVMRMGSRLPPLLACLARFGLGARIYVVARKPWA